MSLFDAVDQVRTQAPILSQRQIRELLVALAQELSRRDICTANYIARAISAMDAFTRASTRDAPDATP